MPVEIKDKYGRVIHRGKNLRILRDYVSRSLDDDWHTYSATGLHTNPIGVGVRENKDSSGELHISFADGSYCDVHFASYRVLHGFVLRWRNLAGVGRYFYSED